MSDFNSFINENPSTRGERGKQKSGKISKEDVYSILGSLSGKFEGASEDEIISAIVSEAEKGRRNGTLTDANIDEFYRTLAPMLDAKSLKKLQRVVRYLKNK